MPKQNQKLEFDKLDANMRINEKSEDPFEWYSPKQLPFQLSGFPWLHEEGKYRRLPQSPVFPLPAAVDKLANCTAGGQIRFQTNSAALSIKVRLSGAANMYHMPSTGQCGFDCYIEKEGKPTYYGTTVFNHSKQEFEHAYFSGQERQIRNITLYFPLYQGVEEVEIGLEPAAEIYEPTPYASTKRVIIYGTSITQGGCAARPGMAYSNILSRRIPLEFINLGFSGNGRGEPELARNICDIPNPACLVLDYEANSVNPETLQTTLPEFIRIYREKHPDIPLLVLSKIRYGKELFHEDLLMKRLKSKEIQMETVEKFRREGDKNIYFHDGAELLGADFEECTVDGVHPTDLGFLRMANGLTPVIEKLLAGTLSANVESKE